MNNRNTENAAHDFATASAVSDLVAYLRQALLPRLAAYVAGADDDAATRAWAEKTAPVPGAVEERLRDVTFVVRLLAVTYGNATTQVWLQAADIMLDDRSPASVLRHGDVDDRRRVIASAKHFTVR